MTGTECLLDIALPVYNGETYLESAIDSILAQDFEDFRLLISDNASTDRTEAICRDYAARDSRIVYFRQPSNIGAAPNFNFLYGQAGAKYFKWIASDDSIEPGFASACVDALENDARAVVAFSRVQVIDAEGNLLKVDDPAGRLHFADRAERFKNLVQFHRQPCYEIFGIFRTEVLRDTQLIAGFSGGDRNLLAHVALRGEFVIIDEELAKQRRHPKQSASMVSNKLKYDVWFDPSNSGKLRLPELNRYVNYAKVVAQEPLGIVDSVRCFGHIGRQMLVRWRHIGSDLKRLPAALRHEQRDG